MSNKVPSVDLDGRSSPHRLFRDIRFALTNSRNIPHLSLLQQRKLRKDVLQSPQVQEAIKRVSEEKSIPEETLRKTAKEILTRMSSKLQMPWLRMLAWFFRKVWRSIYQGLEVNEPNLMKIPELLEKGPVVLIPSHRSYIDFLITSYILFAYDIPVPFIAAGEDFLNLSFVSNLLRFGGAFFIRRTFRGDILYNAIFNEYVQRLTLLGWTLEFFIEGTRSRSGKLLQPKLGLLGIITDVYFDKKLDEISFVPININYEKVIEDAAYTREWLGDPKKKENLENLIKAAQILQHDFGRISLKFCKPISLKEYAEEYAQKVSKTQPNFDPFKNIENRRALNNALAHQIVYDINEATVWSPLSLFASLLLTYRYGIYRPQLVKKMKWLVNEILKRNKGYNEWITEYPPSQLVKLSIERFEQYIEDRKDLISAAEKNSVLIMAFYRNRIIHLFVREGFILTALAALGGDEEAEPVSKQSAPQPTMDEVRTGAAIDTSIIADAVSRSQESTPTGDYKSVALRDIVEYARFLVELLGKEFVYKPHPDDDDGFDKVLETMLSEGVLERDPNDSTRVRLLCTEQSRSAFHYYAGLMWPFIDTYWVACLVLYVLKPKGAKMQPLLLRMQWMADTLISEGKVRFYEACSVETLKNAVMAFNRMGMLKIDGELVSLLPEYAENEAKKVKELLVTIGQYRRKNLENYEIGLPKSVLEDFPIRAKL